MIPWTKDETSATYIIQWNLLAIFSSLVSLSSRMSAFLDGLLGALLIGVVLSSMWVVMNLFTMSVTQFCRIYGITWLQVYLYYTQHSSKDRTFLKAFVSYCELYVGYSYESAAGCCSHVGQQPVLREVNTYMILVQSARLVTRGFPLSRVVHHCRYELWELFCRSSCPMVSASWSANARLINLNPVLLRTIVVRWSTTAKFEHFTHFCDGFRPNVLSAVCLSTSLTYEVPMSPRQLVVVTSCIQQCV
jgi:hypothetical protein